MRAIGSAMHAVFQISPAGKITTWNPGCENLLGYLAEKIFLCPLVSLLTPASKVEYQSLLTRLPRNFGMLETEIIHADGHVLKSSMAFEPQLRKHGKFDGYSVIISPGAQDNAKEKPVEINHQVLKKYLDYLAGTFCVFDPAGKLVLWNQKTEQVVQMTSEEIANAYIFDFFSAQKKPVVLQKIRQILEDGKSAILEATVVAKDGTRKPYLCSYSLIEINNKKYVCGMGLDISERHQHEKALHLLEGALHASVNGIVITRCEGRDNPIVYVNPAFERITGYQAQEVIGRDSRFMAAPGLDDSERQQIRKAINERKDIHVIFRNLRKDGELFWNELTIAPIKNARKEVTHFVGIINDVTASKQWTFHLEHEANHDALTGLANRNLLSDRLAQALYSGLRNKTMVAIVLIDLDEFKAINDMVGHEGGDEVLKAISKRLSRCVRESDTVARLGGDEFVLILTNQPSLRYTLRMIDRLRRSITEPMVVGGQELGIGASLGVSVFPHDGSMADALLHAADVAMYHAKATGRNNCQFFSPEMRSTMEARHKLEDSLRIAIEKEEVFLVFQPRICLKSGKIIGAEALLRWRHPEFGVLLPASFIPLAEENGMIIALGEWVLVNACATLQRFQQMGFDDFVVSINVSGHEFYQQNYAAHVNDRLTLAGIDAKQLELEMAEDDLMRHPKQAGEILLELKTLGIKVAIDDFGAAYSSLSYLQKFPVSSLKIDTSFMEDISLDGAEGAIIKTIIALGHNLNVKVIAEGVENDGQFKFLMSENCDAMQGNYFSQPIHMPELEQLMRTRPVMQRP